MVNCEYFLESFIHSVLVECCHECISTFQPFRIAASAQPGKLVAHSDFPLFPSPLAIIRVRGESSNSA